VKMRIATFAGLLPTLLLGTKDRPQPSRSGSPLAASSALRGPSPCLPGRGTVCLRDTAYMGSLPSPEARWIVFVRANDSIEIVARADRESPRNVARIATSAGSETGSDGHTASHFSYRAKRDGSLLSFIMMDDGLGDSVVYTLQIHRSPIDANGHEIVGSASLDVRSKSESDEFSLIPLRALRNRTIDRGAWMNYVGEYKIAITSDPAYEFCRVPCVAPDTIELRHGSRLVRTF
jgi:hypothetical protein